MNDNGISSQIIEEGEDGDDGGDFEEIPDDTDEDYVPIAEPSASSPSTSTTWKRKGVRKLGKNDIGEVAEGESKKDSVQCPICDKTFKSKYYLKVHNRYMSVLIFRSNCC